jgi:putative SOS response-associated peptidase YedK
MPGKITQLEAWTDLAPFRGQLAPITADALRRSAQPFRTAQVIRLGEDGRPELARMRWAFSKGSGKKHDGHMHARGETVDSTMRFSEAFAERRGILMVETFNVKKTLENEKTEQWVVCPKDRKPLPLAVIWEELEDADIPAFCMITVPANAALAPFEDRMPAILDQKDWPMWLGETDAPYKEIKALLRTFDDAGGWELSPQAPAKKADAAPKPKAKPQMDLF